MHLFNLHTLIYVIYKWLYHFIIKQYLQIYNRQVALGHSLEVKAVKSMLKQKFIIDRVYSIILTIMAEISATDQNINQEYIYIYVHLKVGRIKYRYQNKI